MEAVLPVARLVLAAPFALAAVRGLIDPLRLRRTVRDWGFPDGAVDVVAALVTVVEFGVAAGLMASRTAWGTVVIALAVLLVPAGAAVQAMVRRGVNADGVAELLRVMGLAIPAGIVLGEGYADAGPSIPMWLTKISPAQTIAVGGLLAAFLFIMGRSMKRPGPVPQKGIRPVSLIRRRPELTIGMATYDDFDGVYFTIQALRLYHDLDNTEILVVDNYGCPDTRSFVREWVKGTYVLAEDGAGTAYAKDLVFTQASGEAVLCCDSHVLFDDGVIDRLKRFYRDHPDCPDLLQGPLVYDDGVLLSTHFEPVWRDQMFGIWATDPRGRDPEGEPFEIPMQGLGAFSCRTAAWPGFNPRFRGFGGEEGYLHEKFRRAGGRCLCLPWLRWMHRFNRPHGIPYPLTVEDKLRNYLLGHTELGLDTGPVLDHFSHYLTPERLERVAAETRIRLVH